MLRTATPLLFGLTGLWLAGPTGLGRTGLGLTGLTIAGLAPGPIPHAAGPGAALASEPDPDPLELGTLEIAALERALTFARLLSEGQPRVVAVTHYTAGRVTGVDLSALLGRDVRDPIALFAELGYDALRAAISATPERARITVPAADLVAPVDLRGHHVAAGTNYPEHAGEAEVEDGPFLFAKLVEPTGPYADVSAGAALLDYEVELAWVTLAPVAAGDRPAALGLVLCNDYTDRATLLRHVDVRDPTSGKGFSTGKSFPGYLPLGNLFVVPRDVRRFAAELELRLYVNGRLRQQASVSEQIWDLDRMLAETWARRALSWEHRGSRVGLLSATGSIPDRTLLMSGTPGGTVFAGVGFGARARGALAWLASGGSGSLTGHVIEAYIRNAHAAYLQPGDRVSIRVERLGVLDNRIVR